MGRYAGIAAGGKRGDGHQGNLGAHGALAQSGLPEQEIAERALVYERALQKSVARRRVPGNTGGGVGTIGSGAGPSGSGGSSGNGVGVGAGATGVDKGKSTATPNTADSADNAEGPSTPRSATPRMGMAMSASVPESTEGEREEDEEIGLDDSYVDGLGILRGARGAKGMAFSPRASGAESDDELLDGGVMGLLAQIYDQRKRVAG